jgi:uncharacterized membrane-anchored protein YhcB (DUF1043 family)
MNINTETKQLVFDPNPVKKTKKVATQTKEKKDRVVTQTKLWNKHFQDSDYGVETQQQFIQDLRDNLDTATTSNTILTDKQRFLRSQINGKIQGYKTQDIQKKKLDMSRFVDIECVLDKLIECKLYCFYCKDPMLVWYKHTRDPKQWSLDRIDNDYGHNKNNIEISCLSCNIRRRCMYHDRFRFTKQLTLTKVDHDGNQMT